MKYLVLIAMTGLLGGCRHISSRKMCLAQDGKTEYVIILGSEPSQAEALAAEELAEYLGKVAGVEFAIVSEDRKTEGSPGVYVGWTDFASRHGIDPEALGEEGWMIRSVGKNLIITGGRLRGTLYGVYEFLESQVGCRWLAWDTEVVPSRPTLAITAPDRQGQPAFEYREMYTRHHFWQKGERQAAIRQFMIRNRQQWPSHSATGGYMMLPGLGAHSFYKLVSPELFEKHPEYFSMDRVGNRTRGNWQRPGAAGSNLCLSNPEVARITAENIRKRIMEYEAKHSDRPQVHAVEVSQEDNVSFICICPECKAISAHEGSESGLLLQYLNKVAELVSRECEGVKIRSLFYTGTDEPPLRVRPHDDVIVFWTDLYGMSDPFRPLTHSVNSGQAEKLRGWADIASNIHIWDYWDMGGRLSGVKLPLMVPAETVAADMRFFRDNNVTGIFIENERGITTQSFYDLSVWAGLQLMNNPDLRPEQLVNTFIAGYYGSAAEPMHKYYRFLQKTVRDELTPLFAPAVSSRFGLRFYHMAYLLRCREILLEAEAAVEAGSIEQLHIWREMLTVYKSLLTDWDWLQRTAERDFPFSREQTTDKYEVMRRGVMKHQYTGTWLADLEKDLEQEMTLLRTVVPLPEQFADIPADRITDFIWPEFHRYGSSLVDDPEAAGGKAHRLTTGIKGIDHSARPHSMGVYNWTEKKATGSGLKLDAEDIPQDENYHLYRIGTSRLAPRTSIWAHGSWLLSCFLDRAYQLADGLDPAMNDWDVYVSLKFEGPAYVDGSERENAVSMDRAILVRPDGWGEPQ